MKPFERVALRWCEDPEDVIDKAVAEWHADKDGTATLREHLGMTQFEYAAWVSDASVLPALGDTKARRLRCFCCGERVDPADTSGPSPDDDGVGQIGRWLAMVLDVHEPVDQSLPCRAAVCCWPCFWRFDPDMWIHPSDWVSADPVVPYLALPILEHDHPDHENPFRYPYPTLP